MDTAGFGNSDPVLQGEDTIEAWAAAAHDLLDVLGLVQVAVAGHHTGAAIAVEMAASQTAPREGARAVGVALCRRRTGARAIAAGGGVIDHVDRHADGRHLLELWAQPQPVLP